MKYETPLDNRKLTAKVSSRILHESPPHKVKMLKVNTPTK